MNTQPLVPTDIANLAFACGIDPVGKTTEQVRAEFEAQRDRQFSDQHDARLLEALDRVCGQVDWSPEAEADADAYMANREFERRGSKKAAKATVYCLCGCGAQVARRFKPGHDAKLKGELIRAYRSDQTGNDGKGGWSSLHNHPAAQVFGTDSPMAIATALGWQHFLTDGQTPRVLTPRPAAKPKSSRVQAKVGRWAYEGEVRDGVFHYQDRQGNPLETTHFTLV